MDCKRKKIIQYTVTGFRPAQISRFRPVFCQSLRNTAGILFFLLLIVSFHLLSVTTVSAQLSFGGRPTHAASKSTGEIPVIRMPEFSVSEYLQKKEAEDPRPLKPLIFAKPFELNVDPATDGSWSTLADGTKVWRVALESEGAHSLNLIFSQFRLEPGVSVYVFNPDHSDILGAFDMRNNRPAGTLALAPVGGDRLIIEMQVDNGVSGYGELVIGKLNHDFTGILDYKLTGSGDSEPCNIGINCPEGDHWQTHKNSVVRIMTNGNRFCTGVLVNNTAGDGKPYLLTANHCISGNEAAGNSIFFFGFERPSCNSTGTPAIQTLSGGELLATDISLDFTLLELEDMPPRSYRPWYAGWNRLYAPPRSSVTIHHPSRDFKKIATAHVPAITATFGGYIPNGHWLIQLWDRGTTEPGSSGSPLFNQNGHLVGLLTGGSASCGSARYDYYSKFVLAWDRYSASSRQLKFWLDSPGTGAETIEGFNPYSDEELEADFTVNSTEICLGDRVVFTDFSSGHIDGWFWDFGEGADPPFAYTEGPHYVRYNSSGPRTVLLTVESDGISDTNELYLDIEVMSEHIPVADFTFEERVFKVQFIDLSENAESYYWEFSDTRTSTLNEPQLTFAEGDLVAAQVVRNRACSDTSVMSLKITSSPETGPVTGEIKIYPIPAKEFISIDPGDFFTNDLVIDLYSAGGRRLYRKTVPAGTGISTLDLSSYPASTYILKIGTGNEHFNFILPVLK